MVNSSYSFMRTRKAKTYIQKHMHNRYEFVYFFTGKGLLEFENKLFHFTPNSYYFMRPNVLHSELYENTGKSLVLWFNIPEEFEIKTMAQNDALLNLNSLAEKIRNEMKNNLYRHDLIINALMSEIAVLLARQQYFKTNETGHVLKTAFLI